MTKERTTLHLPTLHCEGCMSTAIDELEKVGVTVESRDMAAKCVTVEFDPDRLSRQELEDAMEAIGFPSDTAD